MKRSFIKGEDEGIFFYKGCHKQKYKTIMSRMASS